MYKSNEEIIERRVGIRERSRNVRIQDLRMEEAIEDISVFLNGETVDNFAEEQEAE